MSVNDIETSLAARQANISQHLALLRHARLVDYVKDGTVRWYYLCRPKVVQGIIALLQQKEGPAKCAPKKIQIARERSSQATVQNKRRANTRRRS
jgi:DNA-binding transcriptional ArsR family regulator